MVNQDQGVAEVRLIDQIRQIIFLAWPKEERERGESGWQIAKYLQEESLLSIALIIK